MKQLNYKKIGEDIVKIIDQSNIESITHCATRLRFVVKNKDSIDFKEIEKVNAVKGVFYNAGQLQVILGTGIVNKVYGTLMDNNAGLEKLTQTSTKSAYKGNKIKLAVRVLADIFVAIIPVIAASGLFLGIKSVILNEAFLNLFGSSLDRVSPAVVVLFTVLTDTVFAFLPALICWSAFKKFGGSPIIGFVIGLMLVAPALPNAYDVSNPTTGIKPIYIFNFIPLVGYQGSVLTAILIGFIGSKFEIILRKKMPNALDAMFTPFCVIVVSVLLSLLVFGPILHLVEQGMVYAVKWIMAIPFGVGGFAIGLLYPLCVLTGMHHLFLLVETTMLGSTGFNPLITVCAMYGFSNAAVCFAISLRSKKQNAKIMGVSAGVSQILGISEPALFGVTIRYGTRPTIVMLFGSALGGGVLSLMRIQANSYGLAVILSPLMYTYSLYQLISYILVGIATFILIFVLTSIFAIPKEVLELGEEEKVVEAKLTLKTTEWTPEMKNQKFSELSDYEKKLLKSKAKKSIWRQGYHIQPPYGLLNDPNGFSVFNNKINLFYQWFPGGPVHGLKHWNHLTSDDLVTWKNKGVALEPEYDFEKNGIYSGSALQHDDLLYIFYTGNKRDENALRESSICLATLNNRNEIIKLAQPIIKSQPEGYTAEFRDPRVFKHEENFVMFVGAQRLDQTGCILVYHSDSLLEWNFVGELKTDFSKLGEMWECPELITIGSEQFLVFSPLGQQLNKQQEQEFLNETVVVQGHYDFTNNSFLGKIIQRLDLGFDFYAPQNLAYNQGNVMVGWMGKPNKTYRSDQDLWANCLTLPRQITFEDNKIKQMPIEALQKLRKKPSEVSCQITNEQQVLNLQGRSYELSATLTGQADCAGLQLCVGPEQKVELKWDQKQKTLKFDCANIGLTPNLQTNNCQTIKVETSTLALRIFVDASSIEVFVNDGADVFTSRIFPELTSQGINAFVENGTIDFKITKWNYKKI